MKNSYWIAVAAIVLMLSGLACVGGGTAAVEATPTVVQQLTLMPTNTPKSSPEPEGATLEITNNSDVDVWYVYLSPADASDWGDDWLGGSVIAAGDTYTIVGIPAGTYDVKAADANKETLQIVWGAEVDGDQTWTITGLVSFEVINESDDMISYLYIAPPESDNWGDDWLGNDVIKAGGSYTVDGIPHGTYDMKAADEDGKTIEYIYNVSLPEKNRWTVSGMTPLPANAVLRFEDEFEDNRNNWGGAETDNAIYNAPADGEYCISIKSDNFTAWEWYEPFRTDEFVAEVACKVSGAEDATCGLGFGPDGDNIYWYEVSPSDQTFALFLLEDGSWQDKLVDWTVSKNINPAGWNYLSMERVNGVVSLYVNGVLASQVDSDRFPTGRVGLGGSTYSEPNATICLDDLSVWRLE